MNFQIDPDLEYRIRSRGVEKPSVPGHRLVQLVRDLVVARHDELSVDGVVWFSAGEVDSLFPSSGAARLVRQRQVFDANEIATAPVVSENAEDDRTFPRDPWYVARGSNVAGPYDQLTIVGWYEQGCLFDKDQLRPGLHASWSSMSDARKKGLMDPPPANSVSSNAKHLVADPPVWMGPPQVAMQAGTFTLRTVAPTRNGSSGQAIVGVMIGFAALGFSLITIALIVAAYYALRS